MLSFKVIKETGFWHTYTYFFVFSLVVILANIGIAVAMGFQLVVFVSINVALLFLLGTFHVLASEIGKQKVDSVIKYFFILTAAAAVIIPCLNVPASNGFIVVNRGGSRRVVFNASVMMPYLDKREFTVKRLNWERRATIRRDGIEARLETSIEFIPRNNKKLIRKLVKEHDGNKEKIVAEIKETVESKLDMI